MSHRSRTWAHFALILVVVLLSLSVVSAQDQPKPEAVGLRPDAPPYAVHGPYWVGTREFVIEDAERPLPVSVWYPALNPQGVEGTIDYNQYYSNMLIQPYMSGHALLDAAPDSSGAPYPIVVFSHGSVVVRDNAPWLLEHLASYGFVVLAPNHPGDTAEDFFAMLGDEPDTDAFINGYMMAFAQRPIDIQRVIAFAETLTAKSAALEGLIDTEKIVVSGYSFGSYTALLVAGARLDFGALKTWCTAHPDSLRKGWFDTSSEICVLIDQPEWQTKLAKAIGVDAALNGLWPPFKDPRVDAVVSIATCYAVAFSKDQMQAMNVPMLMLSGSNDSEPACLLDYNAYPLYENVSSPTKIMALFQNAGHLVFNWKCSEAFVQAGWFGFCSDPVWDMDRAHDLTNHFTTAFLLDVLKGDKDAHAALAPDAVSFPGIEYKAEGF